MPNINRPTREDTMDEIFHYIEYLEQRQDLLNKNGAVALAAALNKQMLNLAGEMEYASIGFENVTSKTFERFVAILKISADILRDFRAFTADYGEEVKEDDKKAINIMESYAKKTK